MLEPTPAQTVGPFFHNALPTNGGAQLVPPGRPNLVRLHGTVYDGAGSPVPDALVEIRQADRSGIVPQLAGSLHARTAFTGWGRAATDEDGRYEFTTEEPGAVADSAAFFAVAVFARGLLDRLFTRAYLPDARDGLLAQLPAERAATLLTVREVDGSLRFDIRLQGEQETVFLEHRSAR
ncbi:protocatechuate 3,4-dioxygenase subunit alpha [Flexivirga sp. ID2601S]|uniref:Protocatechuate 3,4-dioxygenase subunit alpha n=1 Tax=Flexivirga aerilata TaxID=1656889 RepID=A0A849AEJ1_9MICO|nr:protocatechuate 3,4-dioxygenase subunit alpha [Flexivirga aerilata]NNG38327.1 protocatechuate 3,4-dioxygenase subunit alpha [Flexivirga aerilata]